MREQQVLLIGGAAALALVLVSRKTGTNPLTGKALKTDPLTGKPIVRDPVTGKVTTQPLLGRAPTAGGSSAPSGYYALPGGMQPPKQTYFGPPGSTRPPTTASASSGGWLAHLGSILGLSGGILSAISGRPGSAPQPSASRTQGGGGASPSSGGGSQSPGNYNRQSPTAPSPTSGYRSTGYFDENGNWITPELQAQMDANPGGYIDENGEYVPPTDAGVNDNPIDDPYFVGPENFTGPIEPPLPDDSPDIDPGFVGPQDDPSWTPGPITADDPDVQLGSGDPTSGDLSGVDPSIWDTYVPPADDAGGGGDTDFADVGYYDE